METVVANPKTDLEAYFAPFREKVVGINKKFDTPYGSKKIIYADWTASGRLYGPIEETISKEIGPYVGNTHTETTVTGTAMTKAYHKAHEIIKRHVNATRNDVIITSDSGMTGVVNKFQRILGLRVPERLYKNFKIDDNDRPVVFVTHMEHHSNHTSWLETIADVECVMPDANGLIDLDNLRKALDKYSNREMKIASVTACSNVTGIHTDYHEVARVMHQNGGLCFVDFACSAPYESINMHPEDPDAKLDAIYFSPHKFLGGPGSTGVLIFCSSLYKNKVPDAVGGGTVAWTNPWGEHQFLNDIELREDGGTPAFLQTIKTALAVKLKEKMDPEKIMVRERQIVKQIFEGLETIEDLNIMAGHHKDRLGVFSFYFDHLHYNLVVKLLNDRYGIQTRGGCSCAGTYGHYLLSIDQSVSHDLTHKISQGQLNEKPGWVRMSVHPITTHEEVDYILGAISEVGKQGKEWRKDYVYDKTNNEFYHKDYPPTEKEPLLDAWFDPERL